MTTKQTKEQYVPEQEDRGFFENINLLLTKGVDTVVSSLNTVHGIAAMAEDKVQAESKIQKIKTIGYTQAEMQKVTNKYGDVAELKEGMKALDELMAL